MHAPIPLEPKIYARIQGFLATCWLTRYFFRRIKHKKDPTDDELALFWCNHPDQEHSGAARLSKFFCMKSQE